MKAITFKVPIYDCQVGVSIEDDLPRTVGAIGTMQAVGNSSFVIRIAVGKKDPNFYNALSHEVSHVVFGILKAVDVKVSGSTQEVYAYLHGYIFGQIMRRLK